MIRPLPFRLLALGVALFAFGGCATTQQQAANVLPAFTTRLASSYEDCRREGWLAARNLMEGLATVPGDTFPGTAAFVADFRRLEAEAKQRGTDPWELLDADALVTRSPHFWRMLGESEPVDSSMALLHGNLLLAAGEITRGERILLLASRYGRMPAEARELLCAYALSARETLRLMNLHLKLSAIAGQGETGTVDMARLREAARSSPKNLYAWRALVVEKVNAARPAETPARTYDSFWSEPPPEAAAIAGEEMAVSARLDPLFSRPAPSQEDAKAWESALAAWRELLDVDLPIEERLLHAAYEKGLYLDPELTLCVHRLLVARRGFYGPSDARAFRDGLPRLIDAEAAAVVSRRIFEEALPMYGRRPEKPEGNPDGWEEDGVHPVLRETLDWRIAVQTVLIRMNGNAVQTGEALRRRGNYRDGLLRSADALSDLDRARQLLPGHPLVELDRAIALARAGREAEAATLFAASAPRLNYYKPWGDFHFSAGRLKEAFDLYRKEVEASPELPGPLLYLHVTARRLGRPELTSGLRRLPQGELKEWPLPLFQYVHGELTADALLESAGQPGGFFAAQRLSVAHWLIAELALARGDREAARDSYERCISSGITSNSEYSLARRALARLGPRPEPERPSPPAEPSRSRAPEREGPLAPS